MCIREDGLINKFKKEKQKQKQKKHGGTDLGYICLPLRHSFKVRETHHFFVFSKRHDSETFYQETVNYEVGI